MSEKLQNALNEQITAELWSANLYLSMSFYLKIAVPLTIQKKTFGYKFSLWQRKYRTVSLICILRPWNLYMIIL